MYDFGNSSGHNNYINYANVPDVENDTSMAFAVWFEANAVNAGDRHVFAQFAGGDGWSMTFDRNEKLGVRHDGVDIHAGTVYTVDSTPHSFIMSHAPSPTDGRCYRDGDTLGDASVSGFAPSTSSGPATMRLGTYGQGNGEASAGAACKLGQVMVWDVDIGTAGVTLYHAGVTIPNFLDLKFWVRCVGTPATTDAVIGGPVVSVNGTITEHADAVDNYYSAFPPSGASAIYWLIGQYWAPLMAASGLFGSNLRMENKASLLDGIRQAMGCAFYGTPEDHDALIDFAGKTRPSYA